MKKPTRALLAEERMASRNQSKEIRILEARLRDQDRTINELKKQKDVVPWKSDAAKEMQKRNTRRPINNNVELLEGILSNEFLIHAMTRMTREKFKILLDAFEGWMEDHENDVPKFYKSAKCAGESGNRCLLSHRHVLLMVLIHYKDDPTQNSLEALFGVDQTTISRYLKLAKRALSEILPTASNIYEKMCSASTADELEGILGLGAPKPPTEPEIEAKFKKAMGISPVFGMTDHMRHLLEVYGMMIRNPYITYMLDGTHVRTRRPVNAGERKDRYSGKKKHCSFNTNIMINGGGLIVFAGRSVNGSMHDLALFRADRPDLGILKKLARDGAVWNGMVQYLLTDKGYVGIQECVPGIQVMMPVKKKPKSDKFGGLTQEERDYSRMVSSVRISVEHAIGRIKQHARMAGPYAGTLEEFGQDFDVATGLANFHHAWDDIRDGRYRLG